SCRAGWAVPIVLVQRAAQARESRSGECHGPLAAFDAPGDRPISICRIDFGWAMIQTCNNHFEEALMRKLLLPLCVCFVLGAGKADDVIKKEMKLLEGEWSMVSAEREGSAFPEEVVKTAKRVVKGGETTTEVNGMLAVKAKFKVDPSKKPKTIDYE